MPESRRPAAVALTFDPQRAGAPTIAASGHGVIAERLLDAAREAGVPIRHDPLLAEALAVLEMDMEIPDSLYRAVAETLIWAWQTDRRAGQRPARPGS